MTDPDLSLLSAWRLSLPESPDVDLDLVEARFRDALHDTYRLELVVHTADHELAARDFVGRAAELVVGTFRLRGLVARLRHESLESAGVSRYRLLIVPSCWLMRQRVTSRIFQHRSPIDVLAEILTDYDGVIGALTRRLERSYPEREYVVQYGESDLDFALRLLADHGIALATALADSPIVSDALASFAEAGPPLPFRPPSDLTFDAPHILAASFEDQLTPALATARDYDADRPPVLLEGRHFDADAFPAEVPLERDAFAVGKFADDAAGQRRAGDQLEAARAERRVATFEASFPLAAGNVLRLADHPRADANVEWLVIASTSHVTLDRSHHQLRAIPVTQPYRPPPRPTPRIIGTQTAFVVGEGDEEIDVDNQGRVCLRFHWDRRDKSHDTTRRVRVSQGWAGPGYGFVCLPRVGDEVIVDFLDGDPDRPLVVGRVHNGISPPPQQLPEQKAWSTWRSRSTPGGEGFNELTFDDAAGAERIYAHAQRDFIAEVENDAHIRVKGHVYGNVVGNSTGGVKGDGSLSIEGDAELSVSGDLDVDAANITAAAKGEMYLQAGSSRTDHSPRHQISTGWMRINGDNAIQLITPHFHVWSPDIVLDAHGSKITISSGGITIESSGDVVINGATIKLN